jgi:hypothetical protein
MCILCLCGVCVVERVRGERRERRDERGETQEKRGERREERGERREERGEERERRERREEKRDTLCTVFSTVLSIVFSAVLGKGKEKENMQQYLV